MRIIGGRFKGRRLHAPKGLGTRPIPDRVKESVFAILEARLEGARVLDLYCGTGALGIESLSRGAGEAVFVDAGRPAASALKKNAESLELTDAVFRLLPMPVGRALSRLGREDQRFRVIFFDPPFPDLQDPKGRVRLSRELQQAADLLNKAGLLVFRLEAGAPPPQTPAALELEREERYGRSRLIILRARETADNDAKKRPPTNAS